MKDIFDLETSVNAYMKRHGYQPKYIKYRPDEKRYFVRTADYTELEARIVQPGGGQARVQFKIDGKVRSIHN